MSTNTWLPGSTKHVSCKLEGLSKGFAGLGTSGSKQSSRLAMSANGDNGLDCSTTTVVCATKVGVLTSCSQFLLFRSLQSCCDVCAWLADAEETWQLPTLLTWWEDSEMVTCGQVQTVDRSGVTKEDSVKTDLDWGGLPGTV